MCGDIRGPAEVEADQFEGVRGLNPLPSDEDPSTGVTSIIGSNAEQVGFLAVNPHTNCLGLHYNRLRLSFQVYRPDNFDGGTRRDVPGGGHTVSARYQ